MAATTTLRATPRPLYLATESSCTGWSSRVLPIRMATLARPCSTPGARIRAGSFCADTAHVGALCKTNGRPPEPRSGLSVKAGLSTVGICYTRVLTLSRTELKWYLTRVRDPTNAILGILRAKSPYRRGWGGWLGRLCAVTPTSAEGFGGAREYGLRCARSRVRTGERKGDVSGH